MKSSQGHTNNFNLIRLLAAGQVLFVHAFNHNGIGGLGTDILKATPGVPIFYFISGYLISASYIRTRQVGLANFFRNRVLRIYPALIVCVALATIMVALTGYLATQAFSGTHFAAWVAGQMSFFQFYNPDFMRGFGVGVLNGALWTITVELQFYLLTPLLVWLYNRSKSATALLFAISVLSNVYIGWIGGERDLIEKLFSVSFVPWLFMFMLGMHLAQSPRDRDPALRIPLLPVILLYVASMFALGGYELNAQNSINPVSFVLLAAIIFRLAHLHIPFAQKVQDYLNRNDISYGIYLYHMPMINLMLYIGAGAATGIPVVVVGTLILALASWYWVEKPALRKKR